jgi:hypothetical protein
MSVETAYDVACKEASDINEHLPTLYQLGLQCSHITEFVYGHNVHSSWAFARCLLRREHTLFVSVRNKDNKNIRQVQKVCRKEGIKHRSMLFSNSLEVPLFPTDLLFIDTWHVYGQIKRELKTWAPMVSKYIVLHDTAIDDQLGETMRTWSYIPYLLWSTGYTIEELIRGLTYGIQQFLDQNPEWRLFKRFQNNNGLTILKRISNGPVGPNGSMQAQNGTANGSST